MAQSPQRGRSRRAAVAAAAADSTVAGIPGDAYTLHAVSPKRRLSAVAPGSRVDRRAPGRLRHEATSRYQGWILFCFLCFFSIYLKALPDFDLLRQIYLLRSS